LHIFFKEHTCGGSGVQVVQRNTQCLGNKDFWRRSVGP